jgi:hypothetical protein
VDAGVMLLEIEAGIAKNEPVTFAVRKAIEAGVVELIKRGVEKDLWKYKEIIEVEDVEVTADDLEVDEEVIEQNIDLNEQIIWEGEKSTDKEVIIEELDELLNEEKTYQEYLIEKDAGIHDSKEETTIECLPSGDCYDPNWVPVYEEESTNEQNNETSAIVPTIHAS